MVNSISRLLVLEDEKNIGLTLVERLQLEGFEVVWVRSIEEGRIEVAKRRFDLALLDVGLPDGSGFDLAKEIRAKSPATATLFLTAHGLPEDRVRGLELGAEDYVVKPFHFKELLLRIRNALKRASTLSWVDQVQVGAAEVNFGKFEARVQGVSHSLTHKEIALLKLLYERRGNVVSRDDILNQVWSETEFPTARTVDNFIMRLRRLVEIDPENPQVIKSVRGVGYLLTESEKGKV